MDGPRGVYVKGRWAVGAGNEIQVRCAVDGSVLSVVRGAVAAQADEAVAAAKQAWSAWSTCDLRVRAGVLRSLADRIEARREEIAAVISREVGSPLPFSHQVQVDLPLAVLRTTADAVEAYQTEERIDDVVVVQEPVGVVAAITPWNYPLYQIVAKLAPALGAGCSIVVKPSQVAPLSAVILFEEIDGLGLPPGVANLLVGTGRSVGRALVAHPDVDMVSFTGSTEAGVEIAADSARSVKRVALELGGKSANVLLADADLERAIPAAVASCFGNGGQTCSALTRLVVPRELLPEVERRLVEAVSAYSVGDPFADGVGVGPLASSDQQRTVNEYIEIGVKEGARLLVGGVDADLQARPGYYVAPTVLTDVTSSMRVAQEEIFGPVLVVIPVDSEEEAVGVANDSQYGLGGGVWSADLARAESVARQIRTGQVAINGGKFNPRAPFGGFKKSGHGRELGRYGLEEFFEVKAIRH